VKEGASRSAQTPRSAFSRLPALLARQPSDASECRQWRSLDDATLTRLTWLWLGYGAFALVAGQRRLPPACPFRLVTGHRCPLCGLTRSVNCLMRGHLPASFGEHPAGPILYLGSGLLLASAWRPRWQASPHQTSGQDCSPAAVPVALGQLTHGRRQAAPVARLSCWL